MCVSMPTLLARHRVGARSPTTPLIVVWQHDGAWPGYLQDCPDYWTQGETLENLKEHLQDLYQDIKKGVPT